MLPLETVQVIPMILKNHVIIVVFLGPILYLTFPFPLAVLHSTIIKTAKNTSSKKKKYKPVVTTLEPGLGSTLFLSPPRHVLQQSISFLQQCFDFFSRLYSRSIDSLQPAAFVCPFFVCVLLLLFEPLPPPPPPLEKKKRLTDTFPRFMYHWTKL